MKAPSNLQVREPQGKTLENLREELSKFMRRMDENYRLLRQDVKNNEDRLEAGGL